MSIQLHIFSPFKQFLTSCSGRWRGCSLTLPISSSAPPPLPSPPPHISHLCIFPVQLHHSYCWDQDLHYCDCCCSQPGCARCTLILVYSSGVTFCFFFWSWSLSPCPITLVYSVIIACHSPVQNYNILLRSVRPTGGWLRFLFVCLFEAPLPPLSFWSQLGWSQQVGHIAVIPAFPLTFLLHWDPWALDPMPASSLVIPVLLELTAASEVRQGQENWRLLGRRGPLCLFHLHHLVKHCPRPAWVKGVAFSACGES